MKFTSKLFLTWMSIFLIFFLAVIGIVGLFWGIQIAFWKLALVFFIAGIIPPAILTRFFYKRLNYMESENIEPPVFTGQKKAIFNFTPRSKNSHFDEIMQRVDRNWIVSYSDRENNVLKFRSDTRTLSWGIGGYVKLLEDKKVLVVVYPMNPDSKKESKILTQTLRLMRAILNP